MEKMHDQVEEEYAVEIIVNGTLVERFIEKNGFVAHDIIARERRLAERDRGVHYRHGDRLEIQFVKGCKDRDGQWLPSERPELYYQKDF